MFKRVIIGFMLKGVITAGLAQNYQPPTVIPASPATQNFLRYGEIPVDISTGVPNINIPIYTVKSGKLEFPISLSYHASGIKVKDRASIVGLGWVLNASSFVNLTVMSISDAEFKALYPNADSLAAMRDRYRDMNNLDSFRALGFIINTSVANKDYQTDRGFYKLPNGQSGHFRSGYLTGETVTIPRTAIKIDTLKHLDVVLNKYILDGFRIIDETGAIYVFDLQAGVYGSMDFSLTSIISADKIDTLRLVYKSYKNQYFVSASSAVVEAGDFRNAQQSSTPYNPFFDVEYRHNLSLVNTFYTENVLDSVVSRATVVKFNMAGGRLDSSLGYKLYRLSNLTVYDRFSGSQVKSYSFNQSYFGSEQDDNYRLRLDSLSISGSTSNAVEKYRFKYNDIGVYYTLPPYTEKISQGLGPFREDFWGYSNGSVSNSPVSNLFIPDSIITSTNQSPVFKYKSNFLYNLGLSDKLPNYNYAGAGLIQEIQYPTGGKTFFDFEPNEGRILLPSGTIVNQGAGFRIYRIRSYTDNGSLSDTRTYQYDIARQKTISFSTYMYGQRVVGGGSGTLYVIPSRVFVYSTPLESLNIDNGPPVFYEKVTEYYGDNVDNTGKTVYTYEIPPFEYHYFNEHPGDPDGPKYKPPFEEDRGNYTPHLLSKIDYKKVGTQYFPVSKTENQYAAFSSRKIYTGMQVVPETFYELEGWYYDFIHCQSNGQYTGCFTSADTKEYPYYMHHINLNAKQEVSQLIQTKNYLYHSSDTSQKSITTTLYKYDTLTHLQPIEQLTIDSKGDTSKIKFKYPIDYAGTAIYDSMIARRMISPVLEQSSYTNNTFLQSSRTHYYPWTSTLIAPQSVESKQRTNNPETRLQFIGYDGKGNVTTVSKASDVQTSYIWGYGERYPVAELVGVSYSNALGVINQSIVQNPSTDDALRTELNKIRTAYPSAQVKIYTFKPSIGVTSVTDISNRTLYYEYDGFNRLRIIRDQAGKILKKVCYNYAGQPASCDDASATVYNSAAISSVTPTVTCPSGQITASVFVNVPAGQYTSVVSQSHADAQAQAYAQQLANQQAVCFTPVYVRVEYESDWVDDYQASDYISYNQYVTASLKFYSDSACTLPYTLTQNLAVSAYAGGSMWEPSGTTYGGYAVNVTALSGTTGVVLESEFSLFGYNEYFDEYQELIYFERWTGFHQLSLNQPITLKPPYYNGITLPVWY
jgi:hypothetical protein